MDGKTLEKVDDRIEESYIQIEDNFYIGATKESEVQGNKMFLNHSCEPNVGIRGQVSFVAMRNTRKGEELTYDWAMENPGKWRFRCNCGEKNCRTTITGNDWGLQNLQRQYKGFFWAFIQEKIDKLSELNHRLNLEHSASLRSTLMKQGFARKERREAAVRCYPVPKQKKV